MATHQVPYGGLALFQRICTFGPARLKVACHRLSIEPPWPASTAPFDNGKVRASLDQCKHGVYAHLSQNSRLLEVYLYHPGRGNNK
jgi:hypothetical protein